MVKPPASATRRAHYVRTISATVGGLGVGAGWKHGPFEIRILISIAG
jgi:hypothetical protein